MRPASKKPSKPYIERIVGGYGRVDTADRVLGIDGALNADGCVAWLLGWPHKCRFAETGTRR